MSAAESVAALRRARDAGVRASGEVTPHHLVLTDEAVRSLDPNLKMNPPLRTSDDRAALVEALQSGAADRLVGPVGDEPPARRRLDVRRGHPRWNLRDFRRLLASNGRLFFTSFAEEGVPDLSINPKGYRREWSGPLHCVRYRRGFLESLLESSGFKVDRFDYETETDGQSAFACSLKDLPADQ